MVYHFDNLWCELQSFTLYCVISSRQYEIREIAFQHRTAISYIRALFDKMRQTYLYQLENCMILHQPILSLVGGYFLRTGCKVSYNFLAEKKPTSNNHSYLYGIPTDSDHQFPWLMNNGPFYWPDLTEIRLRTNDNYFLRDLFIQPCLSSTAFYRNCRFKVGMSINTKLFTWI